jgi:hypothetical protein
MILQILNAKDKVRKLKSTKINGSNCKMAKWQNGKMAKWQKI